VIRGFFCYLLEMSPKSSFLSRVAGILLGLLAIGVGGIFVYIWQFAFSSDYALIGLIGKRILTTGEQFIFIPQVGYQGLLYEGNLVAFMFKLFGMSPRTLNLAPFLTYLGFCYVYYRAVRAWHGAHEAKLALLFVILSTPHFYGQVLRTQPNYGETFLMGSALFWIYRLLLDRLSIQLCFLFGLIAGFGFYTYGQIIYFIAAIGLHLILMELPRESAHWGRIARGSLAVLLTYFSLSVVAFLTSYERVQVGKLFTVTYMPIAMITSSIALMGVVVLTAKVKIYWNSRRAWLPALFTAAGGGIIGLSPKLYYSWILKQPSLGRMGNGGDLREVFQRATWLWDIGRRVLFNFAEGNILSTLSALVGLFVLGVFCFYSISGKDKKYFLSPFFLIMPLVIGIFLTATSVVDAASIRYALVLSLSVGLAYAILLVRLFKSGKWMVALSILGLSLMTNVLSMGGNLLDARKQDPMGPEIRYLKEKGLSRAFGDYWYAYAITFLTQEKIQIEPVSSNYLPFYRQAVVASQRIGYLTVEPHSLGENISLGGGSYQVVDQAKLEKINIFTLEKAL
jgi:hypothetical protein